jgi:hypothetical protein
MFHNNVFRRNAGAVPQPSNKIRYDHFLLHPFQFNIHSHCTISLHNLRYWQQCWMNYTWNSKLINEQWIGKDVKGSGCNLI